MIRKLLALFFLFGLYRTNAQTPDYFYFDPSNAGVNNLYFNESISFKFLTVYTQAELAAAGWPGAVQIQSIWFKSNTAYVLNIDDLKITLGHSTLTVPDPDFADNFNAGLPVTVLDEAAYVYTTVAGPWNNPSSGWSEIPLTTPFTYNFIDNLVLQVEYSNINYPIPLYAANGGTPITQLSAVYGGSTATGSTARLMVGISSEPASPVIFSASDSTVCQKFCVDFTDLSANNPVNWSWEFEGGSPAVSSLQNPTQICYNTPGLFDVTLVTTDAAGESDTLLLNDFITVYATPAVPSITPNGDTLVSSSAASYQWQLNGTDIPGATNQEYAPDVSGGYSVLVTDENGCFSSSGVFDFTATGLDYVPEHVLWILHPNPSSGIVFLDHTGNAMLPASVIVYDAAGKRIHTELLSNEQGFWMFDFSHFSDGVYYAEILSGAWRTRLPFILSRH